MRYRAIFQSLSRRACEDSSALCFPYQGGEFARIKLFPALGKMKYSQPPKTSARLYMPFPVGPGDITVAEGEKKTLAAHQAGFNGSASAAYGLGFRAASRLRICS